MVEKGPLGEKIGHFLDIDPEPVDAKLATGTWIRWLIRREDGAPTYAMRVFDMEPGGHIKAHSHPWEHEIFVLEGKGVLRIGEKKYNVGKGYFIYIPPGVEHEYWNTGEGIFRFICTIPHKPTA